MKKSKLFVPFLAMCMMLGTTAFGMNSNEPSSKMQTLAKLVNNETGKIVELPLTLVETTKTTSKTKCTGNIETFEVTYSTGIIIPENDTEIMPLATLIGSGHDGTYSYIGEISLVYDRYYDSTHGDYALLLKKFTASWTQQDSAVSISNQTYSYACNNGGAAKDQRVNDKPFTNYINKDTKFTIPIYEGEMTSVCGGEIHGDFRRAGTSWHGEVLCYVVNK